jgi:uncharacterized protein YqgC (DUF456 family)
MVYVYAVVLTLLNLAFWFGIMFNVPGTWLMILFPAILEWWQPGQFMFSWTVLFVALGFAVLGEVLEFVLGAAGSRRAGGSKRAAALAIGGGFIGGIVGTALPVPLFGTLGGACLGAFIGALSGDLWAGHTLSRSIEVGRSAAVGQLSGTVAKLAVGAVIWVIVAFAAFF